MAVRKPIDPALETILSQLSNHLPFLTVAGSEALFHLSQDIGRAILQARRVTDPALKYQYWEEARAAVRRCRRFLFDTGEHPWPGIRHAKLIHDLRRLEESLKEILILLSSRGNCQKPW